jgi:hypothetical protein
LGSDAPSALDDFDGDLFTPVGEPEWDFCEDFDSFTLDTFFSCSSPAESLV